MTGSLDVSEMEALLESEVVGHLGCHSAGRTYVVPVTFAYREGYVYGFTGEGLKVELMRQNPRVCIEVGRVQYFANWQTVIIDGEFQELRGEEAARAMALLYAHVKPKLQQDLTVEELTNRAMPNGRGQVVFRIRVEQMTGRYERHDAPTLLPRRAPFEPSDGGLA